MKNLALIFIILSFSTFAFADFVKQYKEDLAAIDNSIEVTQKKIKTSRNTAYLPEIYLGLAELYVKKAQLMVSLKQAQNPETNPKKLDFTLANKTRQKALPVFEEIINRFSNYKQIDKVSFLYGMELKNSGQIKEALAQYKKVTSTYANSPYWAEAKVEIGNFYFDKKDYEFALQNYSDITKSSDKFTIGFAYYKMMAAYSRMEKWEKAVEAGEKSAAWFKKQTKAKERLPYKYDVNQQVVKEIVWPFSELSVTEVNKVAARKNTLLYFKDMANSARNYTNALLVLGKRLMIKKRWPEAVEAFHEGLKNTENVNTQISALEDLYDAIKKGNVRFTKGGLNHQIFSVLKKIKMRSYYEKGRTRDLKRLEPIMRDYLTSFHERLQKTKRKEDLKKIILGYENYLWLYPKSKYYKEMTSNLAEANSLAGQDILAAAVYYQLAQKMGSKQEFQKYAKLALSKSAEALAKSKKLSDFERARNRIIYRTISATYQKRFPFDNIKDELNFNMAKTYYDERDFDRALKKLNEFLNECDTEKYCDSAALLAIDVFLQRREFKRLSKYAKSLLKLSKLSKEARRKIQLAVNETHLDLALELSGGDETSDTYVVELLKIARKDSEGLGESALYEAFVSLKAINDPKLFSVGQAYLSKYFTNPKSKSVLAVIVDKGMKGLNYKAVADALSIMMLRRPTDSDYPTWSEQALNLYTQIGDFKRAKQIAKSTGNIGKRIEMALEELNSNALIDLGSEDNSATGFYAQGIGYIQRRQNDIAYELFVRALSSRQSGPYGAKYQAHSGFLSGLILYDNLKSITADRFKKSLLAEKISAFQNLERVAQRTIGIGQADNVVNSFYLLALAQHNMSVFVGKMKKAPGTQPAISHFLKSKQKEFQTSRDKYLKQCQSIAKKSRVVSVVSLACENRSMLDDKSLLKQTPTNRGRLVQLPKTLMKKLFSSPKSSGLLNKAYSHFMTSGSYSMAATTAQTMIDYKVNPSASTKMLFNALLKQRNYKLIDTLLRSKRVRSNSQLARSIINSYKGHLQSISVRSPAGGE